MHTSVTPEQTAHYQRDDYVAVEDFLFSGELTMHGSPPNRSGDPRRFIVFEYRADDAYQLADRVFADSGRIVSGRRCGRVRCETGLWMLPRRGLGEEPYGGAWRQIGSAVEL